MRLPTKSAPNASPRRSSPQRPWCRYSRRFVGNVGLFLALALSRSTQAGQPPPDDWSLERDSSNADLIHRRWDRLARDPYNREHFEALWKALGPQRLSAKLQSWPAGSARTIVQARIEARRHAPATACTELDTLHPSQRHSQWLSLRLECAIYSENSAARLRTLLDEDLSPTLLRKIISIAEKRQLHEIDWTARKKLAENASPSVVADTAAYGAKHGQCAAALELWDPIWSQLSSLQRADFVLAKHHCQLQFDAQIAGDELWETLQDRRLIHHSDRAAWWQAFETTPGDIDIRKRRLFELEQQATTPPLSRDPYAVWSIARQRRALGLDAREAYEHASHAFGSKHEKAAALLIESVQYEIAIGRLRTSLIRDIERIPNRSLAPEPALQLAAEIQDTGHEDEARRLIEALEKRWQRDFEALAALLDYYNRRGELEAGLRVAEKRHALRPRSIPAIVAHGEQLFQLDKQEKARQVWASLPRVAHPKHSGYAELSRVLTQHAKLERSLWPAALESLETAMRLAPKNLEYRRLAALLETQRRRPDRAFDHWLTIWQSTSDSNYPQLHVEARTRVIELLVQIGLSSRSRHRALLIESATKNLESPRSEERNEARAFLTELYSREGNYEAAAALQRSLIDLPASGPDDILALATAEFRAGHRRESAELLRQLESQYPDYVRTRRATLAELALDRGDIDEAAALAREALSSDPNQGDLLVRIGERYESQGKIDEARSMYSTLIENPGSRASAISRLAELALLQGRPDEAAKLSVRLLLFAKPQDVLAPAQVERLLDLALFVPETRVQVEDFIQSSPDPDTQLGPRIGHSLVERIALSDFERTSIARPKLSKPDAPIRPKWLASSLIDAANQGNAAQRLRALLLIQSTQNTDLRAQLEQLQSQPSMASGNRSDLDRWSHATLFAILKQDPKRALDIALHTLSSPHLGLSNLILEHFIVLKLGDQERIASFIQATPQHLSARAQTLPYLCLMIAKSNTPVNEDHFAQLERLAYRHEDSWTRSACAFAYDSQSLLRRTFATNQALRHALLAPDPWRSASAALALRQSPDLLEDNELRAALWLSYLSQDTIAAQAAAATLGMHRAKLRLADADWERAFDVPPRAQGPLQDTFPIVWAQLLRGPLESDEKFEFIARDPALQLAFSRIDSLDAPARTRWAQRQIRCTPVSNAAVEQIPPKPTCFDPLHVIRPTPQSNSNAVQRESK